MIIRNDIRSSNKFFVRLLSIAALLGLSASASAAFPWIEGTVKEIRVVNYGNGNDTVVLYLNVVGQGTGCTYNAFVMPKTDTYHAQSYAAMLMAKATGAPVRILFSYCISEGFFSGIARANEYMVLSN